MEGRKRGVTSEKDVIESFAEEGFSLTVDQAKQVLEFLRGLAKVVVNDYLKESACKASGSKVFNNT
jgi:hypothetical protein